MESDSAYFQRRADEETAAAANAAHPEARRRHLELSRHYSDLAAAIDAHEARLSSTSLAG